MENYITIGEIIRHYRMEKGMSQEALSQGICDRKYISNIENDKNIPTLDIINQLSDRLEINLYDTYALMLRHHDIETHKKIETLNSYFTIDKSAQLNELICTYEVLPEFHMGEPAQYIAYAKGLYAANELKDISTAISHYLKVFSNRCDFNINYLSSSESFSNIELVSLNALAVNYCRIENYLEGEKYFLFLNGYLQNMLTQNHFAVNKNNQFELKYFAKVNYNYFLFFRGNSAINLKQIDNTLARLKEYHSNYMLPELLLCKAYLQIQSGEIDIAKQTYSFVHQLGLYLYTETYQNHIEKTTLAEYFERLTETA